VSPPNTVAQFLCAPWMRGRYTPKTDEKLFATWSAEFVHTGQVEFTVPLVVHSHNVETPVTTGTGPYHHIRCGVISPSNNQGHSTHPGERPDLRSSHRVLHHRTGSPNETSAAAPGPIARGVKTAGPLDHRISDMRWTGYSGQVGPRVVPELLPRTEYKVRLPKPPP